jgi:xanthine phosphoribosyltransferase
VKKIYYPYQAFLKDLKCLVQQIDQPFDTIVPISRGGLLIGQMLGEYYDIRKVYTINTIGYNATEKLDKVRVMNLPDLYRSQRVLIVDDIADSGDTLVEVLEVLSTHYPKITFLTATIFCKPTSSIQPTWWVREPQGWIEFFWSEDLRY